MTWNELKQFIENMTPETSEGDVRFIEPYDKQRAGFHVDADYATEDLTVDGGDQAEAAFVHSGEPFLH